MLVPNISFMYNKHIKWRYSMSNPIPQPDIETVYEKINTELVGTQQFIWDQYKLPSNDLSRLETIEKIEKELSPAHAFARLSIDYFYQVNNGGHRQYFENGVHTSFQRACTIKTSPDDDIFQKLKALTEQAKGYLDNHESLDLMLATIDSIRIEIDEETTKEEICESCHGSGKIEVENPNFDDDDEDCDEEEYFQETCDDCSGSGYIEDAHNENYGNLTNECEERCEKADSVVYKNKLDEKIAIAIYNYLLKRQGD